MELEDMILPPKRSGEPLRIGFWVSKFEPDLPDPHNFLDPGFWQEDIDLCMEVVHALNRGKSTAQYRGMSTCRICGELNGSKDLSNGEYVWPSGLGHYVQKHGLRLPDVFINSLLNRE